MTFPMFVSLSALGIIQPVDYYLVPFRPSDSRLACSANENDSPLDDKRIDKWNSTIGESGAGLVIAAMSTNWIDSMSRIIRAIMDW